MNTSKYRAEELGYNDDKNDLQKQDADGTSVARFCKGWFEQPAVSLKDALPALGDLFSLEPAGNDQPNAQVRK